MCIHTLYIFHPCGHIVFSPQPLLACAAHASLSSSHTLSREQAAFPCPQIKGHPFRSLFIHYMCAPCDRQKRRQEQERSVRIEEARNLWMQGVKVDEAKWKVAYGWDGKDGRDLVGLELLK